MEKLQQVDLLLIDDLQCLAGMESTQEEFARLFETLYTQGKQIIITSDRHERELIVFDGYFQRHLGGDFVSGDIRTWSGGALRNRAARMLSLGTGTCGGCLQISGGAGQ